MKKNKNRVLLVLAVSGLLALAMGCGSDTLATPTATPFIRTTLGASGLAFDKLQVDLGTVFQDQDGVQTFLVMNFGSTPITVGPERLEVVEGCDQVTVDARVDQLPPQQVKLLSIRFGRHRQLGPHRILVHIPSTDSQVPSTTLSIRFIVAEAEAVKMAGPRLRVDKEVIDIGTVPNDWPLYEQFTLRNDGNEPLVIEGTPLVRVEEGC